jgi:hypothetical protein
MAGVIRAVLMVLAAMAAGTAFAADPPNPPSGVVVEDLPWDHGDRIRVSWAAPEADSAPVKAYSVRVQRILSQEELAELERDTEIIRTEHLKLRGRSEEKAQAEYEKRLNEKLNEMMATEPKEKGQVTAPTRELEIDRLQAGGRYAITIVAIGEDSESFTSEPVEIVTQQEFFNGKRFWLLMMLVAICGSVIAFIVAARMGMPMTIRRIAALEAVDEAVGRATEMGRPVLFVAGTQDMNEMGTIAGLTALSRVAKTVAEYDAKLEVPTSRSLVMTAARETVESAYLTAGRHDAYNPDLIYYVTDEQFGFVAYITGHMVRQKPATCFYLGIFYAESLILAETGNAIGAIQIAGTVETAQLPFFVAACDYTLIGEEFFAASAYLSGEPDQLGSLKGQDAGKVMVAAGIVLGCVLATMAEFSRDEGSWSKQALHYVQEHLLK